ncbi:hypothetical protein AVEN_87704-1 [Araneus ventricosus]|uniref:Uncharacterized protein n=1 Tax=Araneus ventricosus TaxID=182803 RepID=A0A4Y2TGV0_ARAVE|nr:hypothetical protein AVEN_87704-1 [Araneus ventricosus]
MTMAPSRPFSVHYGTALVLFAIIFICLTDSRQFVDASLPSGHLSSEQLVDDPLFIRALLLGALSEFISFKRRYKVTGAVTIGPQFGICFEERVKITGPVQSRWTPSSGGNNWG